MSQTLRQRLQTCLANGSKADKALASYMLAQMPSLPFETAASLAEKVSLSEPTVGRFCRALGYKSLKDLKASLAEEIGDRPWLISDRLRDFQQRSLAGDDGGVLYELIDVGETILGDVGVDRALFADEAPDLGGHGSREHLGSVRGRVNECTLLEVGELA